MPLRALLDLVRWQAALPPLGLEAPATGVAPVLPTGSVLVGNTGARRGTTVAEIDYPALFNPVTYDPEHLDAESRAKLRALIDWFESRGKQRLIADHLDRVWYTDFLDFIKRE